MPGGRTSVGCCAFGGIGGSSTGPEPFELLERFETKGEEVDGNDDEDDDEGVVEDVFLVVDERVSRQVDGGGFCRTLISMSIAFIAWS
jgi:hypothetical protein